MENSDSEVLQFCIDALERGQRVFLITVLRTWGSSPRPAGSIMAINSRGNMCGSVSGGCIETDLSEKVEHWVASSMEAPEILGYGVNHDNAQQFNLPCGGELELLVEALYSPEQLQSILDKVRNHQCIIRKVSIDTGASSLHAVDHQQRFCIDGVVVERLFGPDWLLLIIGANHLSRFVSRIALTLDFRVIVCDPRASYANDWQVTGTELVTDMPDDAVNKYIIHRQCAVLSLAHDPKLDDMALMDALQSKAFYVGALGSKLSNQKRRQRLKWLEVPETSIKRLHGPVGLPIDSRTPAEIAVSILAEIILKKNNIV